MIRIYVWQASEEEVDVLHRLVNATFGEGATRTITDLFRFPEATQASPGEVLLACGMRCHNIVSASHPLVHRLPTAKQLLNKPTNAESRKKTFDLLLDLSKNNSSLPLAKDLNPEELKEFTIPLLKQLKDTLESKNIEYWKGKTASGTMIGIALSPQTKIPDCETVITFEELLAAQLAISVLNLESLTLVLGEDK